jgi:uncharacterized protein (DUF736 family)
MAKPMTGSLKKNDKAGVETRPDYRGKITLLDGQEFWLSAWINADRDTGEKYMSLKLQAKEQQMNAPITPHNDSKANGFAPETDADDDIPF